VTACREKIVLRWNGWAAAPLARARRMIPKDFILANIGEVENVYVSKMKIKGTRRAPRLGIPGFICHADPTCARKKQVWTHVVMTLEKSI
jgi:hypothetical protein